MATEMVRHNVDNSAILSPDLNVTRKLELE